ncbi:TetR/AcrR family transcriptional regulator [Caballeronia sp. LjRoot34]|uniref:TetR/AcrR family transcriptional regulator n=1 Tax=Caballeronia TaxID=1827195 RepID=UPI00069DEBB5|nr:TetR/AcrR family transcriptional regulator [Caballeronia mineralivorans]
MESPTRSEQTRNAIVEAALTILDRDGAAKLTFEAIARECGISKGAVTHHFHSKSALLKEVFQYRSDSFEVFRRNYLASRTPEDGQQALALHIATTREMVERSRSPARAMLSILADDPTPMEVPRKMFAQQVEQIRKEAPDPDLALLRWEAGWGLALYTLFGLSPLSDEERSRLFDQLLDNSRWTSFERPSRSD